jgi:hypothetical protein
MNLNKEVINTLTAERNRLSAQLERIDMAVSALNGISNGTARKGKQGKAGRVMSASARRRISAAQKARWAKWKKEKGRAG